MLDRRTEELLDQDMLLQLHRSTPGFSSDGGFAGASGERDAQPPPQQEDSEWG